jgi:hypothetical protein
VRIDDEQLVRMNPNDSDQLASRSELWGVLASSEGGWGDNNL